MRGVTGGGMTSSARLPLSDTAFRALEAAYERQWTQAHLLHTEQKCISDQRRGDRPLYAAGAAAREMRRLWAETRRLHERFAAITDNPSLAFTEEERQALRLLGFEAPEPTSAPAPAGEKAACVGTAALPSDRDKPRSASHPSAAAASVRETDELAALRMQNAQLLSSLAWYHLREQSRTPLSSSDRTAAATLSFRGADDSLTGLCKRFTALCDTADALCCTSLPPAQDSVDVALDAVEVAVRELVGACAFPPQVRVVRVGHSALYLIDRPVVVAFASPHSSSLVVRDPEGRCDDCGLFEYLVDVYRPLLEALRWAPPTVRRTSEERSAVAEEVQRTVTRQLRDVDAVTPPSLPPPLDWANDRAVGAAQGSVSRPHTVATERSAPSSVRSPLSAPAAVPNISSRSVGEQARWPSTPQSALSQLTYEELVALKVATLQRSGEQKGMSP